MLNRLTEKLLKHAFDPLVRTGQLQVVTPSGQTLIFGDGGQPQARIRFTDKRAIFALLRDPDLNFGELFMQQRLLVEQGSVYDVLELVLREPEYRHAMMAEVDPRYWIAPALRSGQSFLEPMQGGALKQMGILKPWAPSLSYGLVLRLSPDFIALQSLHSIGRAIDIITVKDELAARAHWR